MKRFLRHAAALALVGWYLMTAPLSGQPGNITVRLGAALSEWDIVSSYDTASECRKALAKNAQETENMRWNKSVTASNITTAAEAAKCVATDDPRLKEK